MEFYLPALDYIVNEQKYSSFFGLHRWWSVGAKHLTVHWFHANVPGGPPFRADSWFHPAAILLNSLYEHPFLCKPVLAILLSFYSIIVFAIGLPLKVALPIYVCLRAKILLLFLLLFSNINSVQRGCCSWRCPQFSTQSQQKTNLEIRFFSPQIYIVKADSERTKLP